MKHTSTILRHFGITAACVIATHNAGHSATVFQMKTQAAGAGAAPAATFGAPLSVSTGSVRSSVPAATFGSSATVAPATTSPRAPRPSESADSSSRSPERRSPRQREVTLPPEYYSGGAGSSKDGMPTEQFVATEPPAFAFSVEAGYSSKHLWRGIDLVEFTSFNHTSGGALKSADSGVTYFGANASYKGFGFGAKYIESLDDELNPFFAPALTDQDSYQELVLSVNYTRMLIGDNILQGTVGFDFYYYPNDEFWGVEHQGMIYARFSSPQYKWAQPFVELFYNVATDSSGSGLAAEGLVVPPGFTSFRGANGSDLVEGYGAEIGVNGGDVVFTHDRIAVGLTYSVSTFYKSGYAFEDDGFSHLSLTVGAPISFGPNFTITPSVTYVHELSDISPKAGAFVQDANPSAYNEPGFVGAIKASWSF